MMQFLVHLVVTALLIMLVARIIPGVKVSGFGAALVAAIVLGLVNAIVRPIMVFLTLPITIVTFGLFLLVVNAIVFWLAAKIVPGFRAEGFGAAFMGALLLTVLNVIVGAVFGLG